MVRPTLAMLLLALAAGTVNGLDDPREQRRDDQPRSRGRDPWVFRCIFEDRTRMVVIAAGDGLWLAFNPGTCSMQKVWRGEIALRGKVWDFSQDNSKSTGEALFEAPSEIWSLPDSPALADGWSATSVEQVNGDGWRFDGTDARLTSPSFDLSRWQRVFVAFDEMSRRGPVRVEISGDGGRTWDAQHFDSTTHGSRDDQWQWNFKQIFVSSPDTRIRFVQTDAAHAKRLRRIRMFGDRPAWYFRTGTERVPARTAWRGYRLNGTASVTLMFDLVLPDGRTVPVRNTPERTGHGWEQVVEIEGLPEGVHLEHMVGAGTALRLSNGRNVLNRTPEGR